MNKADEMMNFFYTVNEREKEIGARIIEFLQLLPDFTDAERLVLGMVIFNNQKELNKAPYMAIQNLIKRGILTEVWTSLNATGDAKLAFVGRAKAVQKSKDGKL